MAKKTVRQNAPAKNIEVNKSVAAANPEVNRDFLKKYSDILIATGIILITFLFLNACLDNQLSDWDDQGYITENQLLSDISFDGIRKIFATPSVMGNYHPLTVLSYALEYSKVQLEPYLYHFDSLMLHLIVTALVYWFILLLSGKQLVAAIAALLFGLHPMHVESVAWAAGRKDVLYGVFYIAALITYVYYHKTTTGKKWVLYFVVLIFFLLALLSKPVAVSLPVSLLIIDYYERRTWSARLIVEKIPFFILAIIFGLKSVSDQAEMGVVVKIENHLNVFDTLTMSCYTLATYLWKAIIPAGLSCFYPYPQKAHNLYPYYYYCYPIAVILLFVLLWKYRKNRNIVFGSLFFLANIGLLLQIIPVGNAIMADRYSYIPYLGIFFIIGYLVVTIMEYAKKDVIKKMVLACALGYCIALGFISNARCKVWYDSISLWSDQMVKQPENAYAYNNLGFEYFTMWKAARNAQEKNTYYDSAEYFLRKSIMVNPNYAYSYVSLATMAAIEGRADEAKYFFLAASKIKATNEMPKIYLGLGMLYLQTRQADSSEYFLKEAIRMQPGNLQAHTFYANLLSNTGRNDEAIKEYNTAIGLQPNAFQLYLNRAKALFNSNRTNEAFDDFNKAISLNSQSGDVYYARALCYAQTGNKALALQDLKTAESLGFKNIDKGFYNSVSN